MTLRLDDLDLSPPLDADASGRPVLLAVDTIDEDPQQPRKEFEAEALHELAATITERGVKQPVSVRPHPGVNGRWMLNFGARRLRASRLAGKSEIPAFIDETADSYDQVIENEQHERLTPLELALFVQRRMAAGDCQAEIARRLGKSRQYVTFATALVDPPDWLLQLYRDGRCRGLTELYELRKLHRENGPRVEAWLAGDEPIPRDRIASLRLHLRAVGPASLPTVSMAALPETPPPALCAEAGENTGRSRRSRHRLEVELDGVALELVVSRFPAGRGEVFVRSTGGGPLRAVPAASLRLLGFAW